MKKILLIAISAFAMPFISAVNEEKLSPACEEKLKQIENDFKKHEKLIWDKSATINNRCLADKIALANLKKALEIAEFRKKRALLKDGSYSWCNKPTVPSAPLDGKRSVYVWEKLKTLNYDLVD